MTYLNQRVDKRLNELDAVASDYRYYINLDKNQKYDTAESGLILDAFRTFVQTHQEFLNIMAERSGYVFPTLGRPVSEALSGNSLTLEVSARK